MRNRFVNQQRPRATRAVLGQGTQALAGLVLQVAAARALGADGLAAFALGYGVLVLATAVCSGLVGDSLTVLDRSDLRIRAGLHVWTAVVCAGAGMVGVAGALLSGMVPLWAALLTGAASAAFIAEDTLRRLLMATGRFWTLPAVDGTSLVLALVTLTLAQWTGGLSLSSFVVALLVGQTGAAAVAWWRLPAEERLRGPWRRPALGAVASFGSWRAAAQTVRPASLTLVRVVVVGMVGAAAYGPLEAARVFTAPTLVVLAGLGSFLLPHFVSLRHRPLADSLRLADRAAVALSLGVALIGALSLAALPWLGPLLTGGDYEVPALAVAGWAGYAVAGATLLPYAGLASVHGGQRQVLALRGLELAALVAVFCVVAAGGGWVLWAPVALAVGPAVTALAVRQSVVVPLVRRSCKPAEQRLEPVAA
jgi:O-antigen/teichoic acid export membrane protein